MATPFGLFGQLEDTRLRKIVTRYIGFLYFELPASEDRRSLMYETILRVTDLDAMVEEF